MVDQPDTPQTEDTEERWSALHQLEAWIHTPMLILSFVWLMLVVVDLARGTTEVTEIFGVAIWIVFILEFALRLTLAPAKLPFLKRRWLTVISLVVPAFRMFAAFRLLRLAGATRGLTLVRIVGTANRSMNALRASLQRRGLVYVLGLTTLVIVLGAAGMRAFEPASQVEGGFTSYVDALWWTAMLVATMGTGFWPETAEGRILSLLLTLYGFGVFGYVTASLASFFIDRDAEAPEAAVAGSSEVAALRRDIAALRTALGEARSD